ncbi:MAG TPA: hypothetical protein VGH27_20050 [Streptosporangiaceae bacterium]|jgi:hypothetical protein
MITRNDHGRSMKSGIKAENTHKPRQGDTYRAWPRERRHLPRLAAPIELGGFRALTAPLPIHAPS